MRRLKRFLGLSKLSAMAALLLGSCSQWGEDIEQEFHHHGITWPGGPGWQFSFRQIGAETIDLDRVLIGIKDICSEVSGHEKEHVLSADSNHVISLNPHYYTLELDMHTADSVWFKGFVPDYRSNMTIAEWNELVKNLNQSQQIQVIFNTNWAEHYVNNSACRRLKSENLVSVVREISR